jgi:hypothetical protein
MYGTTWGQNNSGESNEEAVDNKSDEGNEETLSGVKATVLYDNNAMMIGKD